MEYFGEKVAHARIAKGMMQRDVIEMLAQGYRTTLGSSYFNQIENCTDIPNIPTIINLCKILDLPVDEMVELCKKEEMHAFKLKLEMKYRRRQ